jgi:hypothetical protein
MSPDHREMRNVPISPSVLRAESQDAVAARAEPLDHAVLTDQVQSPDDD